MVYTVVLILHVLGAGILFSTGVFSLVLTTKKKVTKERLLTMDVFEKSAPVAALTQLVTGLILYARDADVFNIDPVFWLKISLFIVNGFLAVRIIKKKRIALLKQKGNSIDADSLRFWTLLELLILIAIIACGVILVETV
jgi:uncharacterized membrane protein